MKSLFSGESSSLSAAAAPVESGRSAAAFTAIKPASDLNALIAGASKDLADYQRLTAEGKLGEAGQKLEQLKQKLEQLNARQK
jgi:hypothetical protein